MTSPAVWYFFSDDLPDGEVIVPFRTKRGLAFGIRPGEMSKEMLKALNATARFILGVGLAHLEHIEERPEIGPEE